MTFFIFPTKSTVLDRVLPPAPYVTETKPGAEGFNRPIVSNNVAKPAESLGGKNSKEKMGDEALSFSLIFIP
jgi:hypothetical protein